jgi:hypothetical protein
VRREREREREEGGQRCATHLQSGATPCPKPVPQPCGTGGGPQQRDERPQQSCQPAPINQSHMPPTPTHPPTRTPTHHITLPPLRRRPDTLTPHQHEHCLSLLQNTDPAMMSENKAQWGPTHLQSGAIPVHNCAQPCTTVRDRSRTPPNLKAISLLLLKGKTGTSHPRCFWKVKVT